MKVHPKPAIRGCGLSPLIKTRASADTHAPIRQRSTTRLWRYRQASSRCAFPAALGCREWLGEALEDTSADQYTSDSSDLPFAWPLWPSFKRFLTPLLGVRQLRNAAAELNSCTCEPCAATSPRICRCRAVCGPQRTSVCQLGVTNVARACLPAPAALKAMLAPALDPNDCSCAAALLGPAHDAVGLTWKRLHANMSQVLRGMLRYAKLR